MTEAPDRLEIERLLTWAGFDGFRRVSGRLAVSDLFDHSSRTGVYVLGFRDGTYYVGKATDVTGRFRDHRESKDSIEWLAFRVVRSNMLDRVEQDTIAAFELLNLPLQNIASTRTGALRGQAAGGDWASEAERRRFLTDWRWNNLVADLVDDPERRRKLRGRFQQLMSRPGDRRFRSICCSLRAVSGTDDLPALGRFCVACRVPSQGGRQS